MFLSVLLTGNGDPPDKKLIKLSKQGDTKAFGELVRRYQKRVYAHCFRYGGSHDVADDLVQDSFVKAWKAIDRFDLRYPFVSWIMRIATNTALNYLKSSKRQMRGEEAETIINMQPAPESQSNPDVRLTEKEMNKRYQNALEILPPKFKMVFVLRMHEDLSYTEIAEQLGITVGTVMSRLHRARKRMLENLQDILE